MTDDTKDDKPDIDAMIREAVEREVTGLKQKNAELLGKLKEKDQSLKPWEGMDPDQVKKLMERLGQDDEARLIAEGKIDEVVNRRVKSFVEQTSRKLETTSAELEQTRAEAQQYSTRYRQAVVDNAVARSLTGIEDGALPRIQREVRDWFEVDDQGEIKPTDKAPLRKDGKPISLKELGDHLQETTPFYFKRSAGAGAQSGKRFGGFTAEQLAKLKPVDRLKLARRQTGG